MKPAPLTARPFLSIGLKMMLVATFLLIMTFGSCGLVLVAFAKHALRADLEAKITQDSQFLASLSQDLISRTDPVRKRRLLSMAEQLLKKPEILAVTILDPHRQIVVHTSHAIGKAPALVSLQVPIRAGHQTTGWVRAWYAPGFALQEFWSMGGDLALVLLCVALVVFGAVFMAANEWMLVRPFKQFLAAIDEVEQKGQVVRLPFDRGDEWGLLGARLNLFLHHLADLRLQSEILFESSRLLGSPLDLRGAVESVLTALLYRFQLTSCVILTPGPDQKLHARFSAGISTAFTQPWAVASGQGVLGAVWSSGARQLIPILSESTDSLLQELDQRHPAGAALILPMRLDSHVYGVAAFFSRSDKPLNSDAVESLDLFADQLALALRNGERMGALIGANRELENEVAGITQEMTRANRRLIQKARELKTVYDLALATAASSEVEDIIDVLIKGVKDLLEVQSGVFFFLDESGTRLEPLWPAFDLPRSDAARLAIVVEDNAWVRSVLKGEMQILNFVDQPDPLPVAWKGLGIRSILALPLKQDRTVRGLFCVINKVNGLFDEDDVRLLSLLVGRVTDVLHRLRLDQQLRQRVQDLSTLQEMASRLPSPPLLQLTAAAIARVVRQALPQVDLCFFFLCQPENDLLSLAGGDWVSGLAFDARGLTVGVSERTAVADAFQTQQEMLYEEGMSGPSWENDRLLQSLPVRELMYLPLKIEQRNIGVMALGRLEKTGFSAEDRRLTRLLAEQVGVMIERSRLYERLRSANEKLEQINQLKNEFISMVSHELRTPLTTIKGFVAIVLDEETGKLNAQQRKFLENSHRAIDRLTLLVSDLLDISRIEAGQIQMQLSSVDLKDLIQKVGANFAPQMKKLELILNVPEKLPKVMGDPNRLMQVLDNLMTNALKFTTKGGITLSAFDKGDYVLVSVRDTGTGIPLAEQDKIFEKFYQVKIGGAWPSKGTGLGLAIVKSIVESHRGKIWVDSETGKGTDFRFLLPRARPDLSISASAQF